MQTLNMSAFAWGAGELVLNAVTIAEQGSCRHATLHSKELLPCMLLNGLSKKCAAAAELWLGCRA